jgi:hypothetical protein
MPVDQLGFQVAEEYVLHSVVETKDRNWLVGQNPDLLAASKG